MWNKSIEYKLWWITSIFVISIIMRWAKVCRPICWTICERRRWRRDNWPPLPPIIRNWRNWKRTTRLKWAFTIRCSRCCTIMAYARYQYHRHTTKSTIIFCRFVSYLLTSNVIFVVTVSQKKKTLYCHAWILRDSITSHTNVTQMAFSFSLSLFTRLCNTARHRWFGSPKPRRTVRATCTFAWSVRVQRWRGTGHPGAA